MLKNCDGGCGKKPSFITGWSAAKKAQVQIRHADWNPRNGAGRRDGFYDNLRLEAQECEAALRGPRARSRSERPPTGAFVFERKNAGVLNLVPRGDWFERDWRRDLSPNDETLTRSATKPGGQHAPPRRIISPPRRGISGRPSIRGTARSMRLRAPCSSRANRNRDRLRHTCAARPGRRPVCF